MFFDALSAAPPDPVFGLLETFAADPRPEKINLMIGIYKNEHLEAKPLSSVLRAKERVNGFVADYLPIDGLPELPDLLGPVVFGRFWNEEIYAAHVAGGTGALRAGAELLFQEVGKRVVVPNHTWPTHRLILERVGFKVGSYSYYSERKKGFDLEGMIGLLSKLPEKSVVLLHVCCHNPTGVDPSVEEWRAISRKMREKKLFPFFDFAYQGFGVGVEEDARPLQIFCEDGHEMLVAYSCSKNFSMYCQRVGMLFAVGAEREVMKSQMRRIIRALYSNPPAFGARIVAEVLRSEPKLWREDLAHARKRLNEARNGLVEKLGASFSHVKGHRGMFSFLDLNQSQVARMIDEFAVYMGEHGRISLTGLSRENIDQVARGILSVCGER